MQSTSIRIRQKTLEMLKSFSKRVHAGSLDEAIVRLLQFYRSRLLDEYFGIDKGKLSEFTEEDRLEDRDI